MTRGEMLNNVVARYGFENLAVIRFAWLVENASDERVENMYNFLMSRFTEE